MVLLVGNKGDSMRVKKITEYEIFTGEKFQSPEDCHKYLNEVISNAEKRIAADLMSNLIWGNNVSTHLLPNTALIVKYLQGCRSEILTIGFCLKDLQELALYEKQTEESRK